MHSKTELIGHLGKDPEVRRLESGNVVAKFTMATSENWLDKKSNEWQTSTEWHTVIFWGAKAESVERNLKKGILVFVEGKNATRKWTDKDGNDRYTTEIKGSFFKRLTPRETNGHQDPYSNNNTPQRETPATSNPNGEMPADDLPF